MAHPTWQDPASSEPATLSKSTRLPLLHPNPTKPLPLNPFPPQIQFPSNNPFVEDQSHLRPTLVTGLLESLKFNQSRGVAVTRLCETGRVFLERDGQNVE
ncbi:MAG: hypothetical protein RL077_4559 [Verrucomicrobiota bacterium]